MRRQTFSIAGLMALAGSTVAAQPPQSIMAAWSQLNHAHISVSDPGSADSQTFDYDIAPNKDLHVQTSIVAGGEIARSEILLLADGILLTHNLPLTRREEIDAVDVPLLTLRLVNQLLAAGSGKMPAALRGKSTVDLTENSWRLEVSTISAAAEYPAPWRLKGRIEVSPTHVVNYDLLHSFHVDGTAQTAHYVGSWERSSASFALDDALPLRGWRVFKLGAASGNSVATVLDYSASELVKSSRTLGELRNALQQSKPDQ